MEAETRSRTGVLLLECEYFLPPYWPDELVPSDAIA